MDETTLSEGLMIFMDRARQTLEWMVPPDLMPGAGLAGLILLAAGLFSGIFGVHYSRGILSAILGGLGFAIGFIAAGVFEIAPILGGLAGLLALASLGYYTHRLWVGAAVGLLASSIGLFAYGHDSVWPAFLDYEPNPAMIDQGEVAYELQSVSAQEAYLNPRLLDYLEGFYQHLKDVQPQVSQNAAVISTLCLVAGFVLGVFLTRWALILSCALIGTVLVNLSLASFAEAFAPGAWTERLSQHPKAVLAFISTCFLLSVLIQFRITQQTTPPAPSEKPKS